MEARKNLQHYFDADGWLKDSYLWSLRQQITLGSIYISDYNNTFGIDSHKVSDFFEGFYSFIYDTAVEDGVMKEAELLSKDSTNPYRQEILFDEMLLERYDNPEYLKEWYWCFCKDNDDDRGPLPMPEDEEPTEEQEYPSSIKSMEDVRDFIEYIASLVGEGFHPDDLFEDYADRYGFTIFSEEECREYTRLMDEALKVCGQNGKDIYEFCMKVFEELKRA